MKTKRTHPFHWTRLLSALAVVFSGSLAAGGGKEDWPSIAPEELAMTTSPAGSSAHAIILYHESITDDTKGTAEEYFRIKVLDEQGIKYGDVEVAYFKDLFKVEDIRARTVHSNGSVVDFDGAVFEKIVLRSKGLKIYAKTLTLPDVRPGSILEYRYRVRWSPELRPPTVWYLQGNLFTRRAHFSIRWNLAPVFFVPVNFREIGFRLPADAKIEQVGKDTYQLDLANVPAFEKEEYAPPEEELRSRVQFFYSYGTVASADEYWKDLGKGRSQGLEQFLSKHKLVDRAVAGTISPNDSPEMKLRKLYARAQQVRNISIEPRKTEKEEKREKIKEPENVDEVMKHGYGHGVEINRLFVALARSAGFDAHPVFVASRNRTFFHPQVRDSRQFTADLVVVRQGTGDLYLDPACHECPYGLLPWYETDTQGLRIDKDSGTIVTTSLPHTGDAILERKATLNLNADGALEGKLRANFIGQRALEQREEARDEDDAGRRKQITEQIKKWLPDGSSFELGNIAGWESSEAPFQVEGTLRVPAFATIAGRRLLFPVSVFRPSEALAFQHANRLYPVYFPYPYQVVDDVSVELPEGYRVESVPSARKTPPSVLQYEITAEPRGGTLHVQRRVTIDGVYFPLQQYGALRAFFSTVKTGDEDQAVLKAVEKAAQN